MSKEKKRFNLRSFTSFSLVISTIIMSWSGFILYVAPPGRIANWGSWKLMLFTKAEWQALHTIFSYLFFILVIIHLFFVNWKTFLTYLKSKLNAGLNRKWELAATIMLSSVIFAGTLRSWTPFGQVMSFGEKVKEGWGNKFETPPVIHMENYSIRQLATIFNSLPSTDLINTLKENKLKITGTDTTLKQIAERNRTTPIEVYNILTLKYGSIKNPEQGPGSTGQGFGKYTLKMVSEISGRDLNEMIGMLKDKGIDATPESSLRTLAGQLSSTPKEVYDMLTAN